MGARGWYFAWLGTETEPFDPLAHHRRDIGLKSVSGREEEGGAEAASCTVVTERMSSAAFAGRRWAMLSFELPDGTLVPVMRMKRRPVPAGDSIAEHTLQFDALPSDWISRRDAGLENLKVVPFFDPLLVSPTRQNDPTEILDGHRRIGHFDRVTQAYSTPELLGVGLPSRTFRKAGLVGWKDGGGVKVRQTKSPLAGVQVYVTSAWQQADDGWFEMSSSLRDAFPEGAVGDPGFDGPSANSVEKNGVKYGGVVPSGVLSTLTPDELDRAFPKPGASLGGASGYTVIGQSLTKIPVPMGAPARTGAVRGQKARYDYTSDADVQRPKNLGLDIAYYEVTLALQYSLRQRREERLSFYVPNANVGYADGAVETITLRTEDPTVDPATVPWTAHENVPAGETRRIGWYTWLCKRTHLTAANFAQDLEARDGTLLWERMLTDQSPIGGPGAETFFLTPRGGRTIAAAGHKALKKIALSQRCVQVTFVVPFEDVWGMSTAWAARVEVDDKLIPGGVAWGKVVSIEFGQSSPKDFAKATVTIECCDGGGLPGPGQDAGVNPTDEPWDGVTISEPVAYVPAPTPVPGGQILVGFAPGDQVAYVQARDFTGQPGRNDRTANDPHHLLTQCKTTVTVACNPINGQPTLVGVIPLESTAWSGPRQVATVTQ